MPRHLKNLSPCLGKSKLLYHFSFLSAAVVQFVSILIHIKHLFFLSIQDRRPNIKLIACLVILIHSPLPHHLQVTHFSLLTPKCQRLFLPSVQYAFFFYVDDGAKKNYSANFFC